MRSRKFEAEFDENINELFARLLRALRGYEKVCKVSVLILINSIVTKIYGDRNLSHMQMINGLVLIVKYVYAPLRL